MKLHAKAYSDRGARAVAEITRCVDDQAQTTIPDSIKEELKDRYRDSVVQQLKREMKHDDM